MLNADRPQMGFCGCCVIFPLQYFNPFALIMTSSSRVICPTASAAVAANPSTGVLWTTKPYSYQPQVTCGYISFFFPQNTTSRQNILTNCFQNGCNGSLTHFFDAITFLLFFSCPFIFILLQMVTQIQGE